MTQLTPTLLAASLAAAFGSFAPLGCVAEPLPSGGKVVAGQASITKAAPNTLQVHQGSANAAIDWQSFNVGRDVSVVFQQPSARSIMLNRVIGADPSQILGRIQANGQVFLINPHGIVFGRDARVDVAGLVASTANIRNDDFMAGRLRFTSPGQPGASVVNEGQITVREGGLAALMAPSVANRGTITARLGTVALASGEAFTLDPHGDRLIGWVVPAAQLSSVINEGTLSADGGSVQISTRAAASVVDGVINLGGTVRARSVGERGGRVVLDGDRALQVAGVVDVSGAGDGERGGTVRVSGRDIHVAAGASIDARGDAGGGSVYVGGGWRGAGGSGTVASTTIDRGARIDVSALTRGAGGEAVVWSDGRTRFDGRIDARGGAAGGDGGRVEVSGHRLGYDGQVDAAAPNGQAGLLLLDPGSLRLQSRSAPAPTASGTDVVTTESINAQLSNGTNVSLTATQDITVADRIDARLVTARGARLNRTGANLSLTAGADLHLDSDVVLDGGSFSGIAGGKVTQASTAVLATGGGDALLQAGAGIGLQSVQGARGLTLSTQRGSIELGSPIGLTGRFTADVLQAQAGDRVRLAGLIASSTDAQPAVAVGQAAGNSGAASVQIDDHIIAAGAVDVRGASVTLAASKAIDTRAASGGRAGSAVTVAGGAGGVVLNGNVYVDDAAVAVQSLANLTQANAAAITSGSGAITLAAAGTTTVSRVQTTGKLTASGARVVFDAGTTDFTVQVGTLQVNATGGATNAVDVRSSIKLGAGESTFTSANDFTMQPATLIDTGATGRLTIDAARNVTIENLKSAGAGVLLQSTHGNVVFNKDLGGRAAGDAATVKTLGGDTIPEPTLYALDVRAPEGKIEAKGLLLYGLKGALATLDSPAAGTLVNGLSLGAKQVFVRGLVFVLDGAVSIDGTERVVIGNSIRSANGYAMSIGGGEIDLYRPTRPDGSEYKNTDIIVAQYSDGSLKFFEELKGVWQQSTSFLSVVMPADLNRDLWIDRTTPPTGSDLLTVSRTDPSFAVAGQVPTRLVSLPDQTSSHMNPFNANSASSTYNGLLASYDPAGKGRNPFVPLVYDVPGGPVEVTVRTLDSSSSFGQPVNIPGTRFVPKILISNDPGAPYLPPIVVQNGVPTGLIGRIVIDGRVYESDAQGERQILDTTGGGKESAGDLRNVALKIASFDTRSVFQDSRIAAGVVTNQGVLGPCSARRGTCIDDPLYPKFSLDPTSPEYGGGQYRETATFNDYPRIVYPDSNGSPRPFNDLSGPVPPAGANRNPVSRGFQAQGYLAIGCVTGAAGACERPVPSGDLGTYYSTGEQPANANPNALSASLLWRNAQPGIASVGRYEYFVPSVTGSPRPWGNPILASEGIDSILGLSTRGSSGVEVKIGANVSQSPNLSTFDAGTPTRTVLSVSNGVLSGQGFQVNVDGTSTFKTSLPVSIATTGNGAAPTFSTITPTLLSVSAGRPPLTVSNRPGAAQVASSGSIGDTLNGLQSEPADADTTLAATASASQDERLVDTGPLLVLGGRGLAQSVDLGRSGGLGVRPSSATAEHEVACTADAAPRQREVRNASARRSVLLPPCR